MARGPMLERNGPYWAGFFLMAVVYAVLVAGAATVPIGWLWQWLGPHVGGPQLGLVEVFGLLVLGRLLVVALTGGARDA